MGDEGGVGGPHRRKKVFFLKKKQKTFAPAPLPRDACLGQLARMQAGKSFLVLFFKKEHLAVKNILPSGGTPTDAAG